MPIDLPLDIDFAQLQRALGGEAPALLLSAAAGPQGRRDLLPLVAGEPLVVPYPRDPSHAAQLAKLRAALCAITVGGDAPAGAFRGGWLLYLAYEFGSVFETRVPCLRPELDEPLALLWRVPALLRRERAAGICELVGEDVADWQPRVVGALRAAHSHGAPLPALALAEDDPQGFLDGVARIHAYLSAGDTFQVNLSRAWRASASRPIDPHTLFARLTTANPAPFAGLLRWAGFAVASSSPERLEIGRAHV